VRLTWLASYEGPSGKGGEGPWLEGLRTVREFRKQEYGNPAGMALLTRLFGCVNIPFGAERNRRESSSADFPPFF